MFGKVVNTFEFFFYKISHPIPLFGMVEDTTRLVHMQQIPTRLLFYWSPLSCTANWNLIGCFLLDNSNGEGDNLIFNGLISCNIFKFDDLNYEMKSLLLISKQKSQYSLSFYEISQFDSSLYFNI